MNEVLQRLFESRPLVHRGETETTYLPAPESSLLGAQQLESIHSGRWLCWGIEPDVAEFLYETVQPGWNTLETGCGITSLIFALRQANHIVVTPHAEEADRLKQYGQEHGISLDRVAFALQPSEIYLPQSAVQDLDLVLIDGKHAFPWPILDWFYTAEKLKIGGLLLLDDTPLSPVQVLVSFLKSDQARWRLRRSFARTVSFQKVGSPIHDVAWYMQPFAVRPLYEPPPTLVRRLRKLARQVVNRLRAPNR